MASKRSLALSFGGLAPLIRHHVAAIKSIQGVSLSLINNLLINYSFYWKIIHSHILGKFSRVLQREKKLLFKNDFGLQQL